MTLGRTLPAIAVLVAETATGELLRRTLVGKAHLVGKAPGAGRLASAKQLRLRSEVRRTRLAAPSFVLTALVPVPRARPVLAIVVGARPPALALAPLSDLLFVLLERSRQLHVLDRGGGRDGVDVGSSSTIGSCRTETTTRRLLRRCHRRGQGQDGQRRRCQCEH